MKRIETKRRKHILSLSLSILCMKYIEKHFRKHLCSLSFSLFAHIFVSNLALFRLFNMKSSNGSTTTTTKKIEEARKKRHEPKKMEIEWESLQWNWISHIFHHHVLCSTTCQRYDCRDFKDLHQNFITVCGGFTWNTSIFHSAFF